MDTNSLFFFVVQIGTLSGICLQLATKKKQQLGSDSDTTSI